MKLKGVIAAAAAVALAGAVAGCTKSAGTKTADADAGASEQPTLVAYSVVDGETIPQPLTGASGDPVKGKAVVVGKTKGNCLACHTMPIPEEEFHGLVGPDLAGVASRWSEGEIRMRLVDPKVFNPDTPMPSFYKLEGLNRVAKKFQDKPVLTAEEVEDVVAYLMTLK